MSGRARLGNRDGQDGEDGADPVSLPEHASAYYSPRPPPVATDHETIEIAAVKLDASVDPRTADTAPMSVEGLDPPPWLAPGPGPGSDAPTVLLPAVRTRRRRRRVLAALLATIAGLVAGVWFGLRSLAREAPEAPSGSPRAASSGSPSAAALPRLPPSVGTPAPVAAPAMAASGDSVPSASASGNELSAPPAPTPPAPKVREHARSARPRAWLH